jgi:hypothetical protein
LEETEDLRALYRQASRLTSDGILRGKLEGLAADEACGSQTIRAILARMDSYPQSEIINRQGAKNAKTRRPYWGRQTELLKASRTGSRVLDWKVPNTPSMAALASWRFKVFLGSGLCDGSSAEVA